MNILVKNNSVEEINAALLRLTRSFKNEQASLEGKVTNIVSGSSKANGNEYNDSLLRQMIKALQDLTTDHTKQINNLTEEQNTFNKKIQSITTMLGNINWSYDPESRIATYIDKDGKAKTWTIKDTTYTFSFDDTTQTLTIHDDTQTKVNPDWDPNDPDSPQYIPDDTNDFVQQIVGATYTFTWSNGSLTIHNNLSTQEHPIADVVIDFDARYYTEDEIDAFITSLDTRLDAIEAVIPSEATANNKLADKAWVATAISISAATFRGTFNSLADLQAYAGPKDANDFAFVKTSTGYDQYTYVVSGSSGSWTYEFSLETLSGTLSVQAVSTDTRVYPTGTAMCSGCDNVTTLCGAPSTLFFNPANGSYHAQKYGTNTGCCCDTGGITAKFGTSINQDLNISLTTASGSASGVGYGELEIATNTNHGFKYNPYTGQMTLPQIVLNPDETYSGAYSGGLRINRTEYDAGHSAWSGVMLGGTRNSVCANNNLWWIGTNWSETGNSHGNDGKLFVTYEGAASDNQRRGYFTKYGDETLWRGNVSGNIYKDAEFVNWKNIDLSTLDNNTIYPVIFSLRGDSSITHIKIHNALDGAPVPSWATHGSGFSAELDMYDQPQSWGTMNARRYVKQADIAWTNAGPELIWGYSQLTHTSIGVLWLRGGAIWRAWNSADQGFTVITSTWDDGTGDTIAPVTPGSQPSLYTSIGMSYDTASNAIYSNSVIDYNNASHPISIGFCGTGLSTASYLAAYSADGNCIKDLSIANAKPLLAPNFLELANPTTDIQTYGYCWYKELFDNYITNVGYRNHQGLISQIPSGASFSCMGIYVGRNDNFAPGCADGTCYWFSPNGEISGTNQSRSHAIELIGKSRFLSVFSDNLGAICDNLMLLAKNYGDNNNMLYLKGWCPSCQTCIQTRVDQAYWSYCTDSVCLYNQTDINADYEIPTVVNATPGAWSLLGITCYNCGKPTWNPLAQTLKAPRILAGEQIGFGFNNNTINNTYSSIVPYVCILPEVNNQPLYVRVCFLQNRNQAGGHFHISHWQFDATINLDQAGNSCLAYYCGATYGTSYFSIPPYTCSTQYMWLYFADSWWSPRISADIPFCVDTYRSTSSAQDAEIGLGGGWHGYTDLRNSGGSVDNATCFNGYTWAQACAIFTGSVTPSVRCDDTWYEVLGVDSNGNLVKSGCNNMWFNPGQQMNAMCAITTNPMGGLSSYYEGLRLNRSCSASGDSWTTLVIGDCWGTFSGNCDGIWVGRHHTAADNQKLFFTWQSSLPANNCGYMYFPTATYGACWCGNVYGHASCNIGSFLGTDCTAPNNGDWHKMVTGSGLSNGQWQHVLNLNWTTADNEWTSRLYLPTNYMTSCKHMYFSTNGAGCVWEVLDNAGETQYKSGGIGSSWFSTAGISVNKQTGALSCGTTYYIHLYDINFGANAYRGTVDVDYSIYGSGVVDTVNLRASSNGYDNSLESMGVCLNRTSYGGQSDSTGNAGLVGIGFIHSTAYSCSLQVWGKFIAYDNFDYTQYLGMNLVNTRNLSWCGNGITTTSPAFTCFVCVKPSGQKGFHWFSGEVDGVVNYAVNAECSNFAFAACCAISISVPVCCITIPAGCKDNYIRLTTTTSPRGIWNIYDSGSTFKVSLDRGNTSSNLSWCRRTDSQSSSCSSMLLGASLGYTSSSSGLLVRVSTTSGCDSAYPRTFYIAYEDETGQKAPPEMPTLVCCSGWNLDEHCFVSTNVQFAWDNCMNEYNRSQCGQCISAMSRMIIPVGVTSNVNGSIWLE